MFLVMLVIKLHYKTFVCTLRYQSHTIKLILKIPIRNSGSNPFLFWICILGKCCTAISFFIGVYTSWSIWQVFYNMHESCSDVKICNFISCIICTKLCIQWYVSLIKTLSIVKLRRKAAQGDKCITVI